MQCYKLFPRLAGSYEALEAGNTGDALVDFTGGVCESINLKDGGYSQDTEKRQTLFKSMERAMKEKSLISASIRVCSLQVMLTVQIYGKNYYTSGMYHKDSCITFLLTCKFWAKNCGCGLYTRPFLSERVNWFICCHKLN